MQTGDRLRLERERLGHTQTEMAKISGVAFRTYCDYEAGKTEPKASLFEAIHKAGADVMYILTGQRSSPQNISMEEQKLVENYRAMDDAARLNIQAVGDSFAQSKPKLKSGND
ncbi:MULTISPECIES: helix-turn-helix domain-containing protein [Serratia]|uniref:Helix-turn-helix domain-containing protein n=1 Tax=Serratia marcescens TaxID=615 RepID=A0ABD6HN04_SERMA|nr:MULTISPECIES: helix-turn-helix transcriptional regulator [Serratia]MBJ2093847.1 helix-turn-helix transcriptional regulator [Serratia ureilytica]MVF02565.1 helix-turn-helix domain-containing protein [Serratia marcescens]HAT4498765.1 helix-turn-helix transcriptional regulator [Serratia marcescens]HAT4512171.1 helix-turn-helix transcriptional regulator [Serratia marcescens]HAT4536346.1 helix-turn-helix transcriptional regulator [Serratia marcescens]